MAFEQVYPNIYERLPIFTNSSHCARALAFMEQGDIYFGIGRTTPWEGEVATDFIPPEPDVDTVAIEELVGLKKADRVAMVIPDDEGEIEYATMRFRTLTQEEAFQQKSRWVLVEVTIRFDELPPVSYRQIGIYSRVRTIEGSQGKQILMPNEIEDVGLLEVINNRKVVTRQSETKDTYFMILEF